MQIAAHPPGLEPHAKWNKRHDSSPVLRRMFKPGECIIVFQARFMFQKSQDQPKTTVHVHKFGYIMIHHMVILLDQQIQRSAMPHMSSIRQTGSVLSRPVLVCTSTPWYSGWWSPCTPWFIHEKTNCFWPLTRATRPLDRDLQVNHTKGS